MINIYTGRENLDKDRFMFDQIAESLKADKQVILIVPDQYTLQAERNAFSYLNVPGIMDFEVLSFSRLSTRVFGEIGGGLKTFVNNYGKFMMISRILLKEKSNLKVFKDLEGSTTFVDKINDFIAEVKNHNMGPEDLKVIIESENSESLLMRKLEDISKIYDEYERRMGSEQIDTVDSLDIFISKIKESKIISESEFWISGFDYLTPKNQRAVQEIAKQSRHVSIVLTAEDGNSFFKTTNGLSMEIVNASLDNKINIEVKDIDPTYIREEKGREPLSYMEGQLCCGYATTFKGDSTKNVQLVSAANMYAEAETAASKICEMVRDESMRYRDILVICNDMEIRASIIKRVFSEYELPLFIDQKRSIHHNPVLEYITSLLEITGEGWHRPLIFKLLKTGLTDIDEDKIEELENYCIQFNIMGRKWKRDFTQTANEYTDEQLSDLNEVRTKIVELISGFEKTFKKSSTVGKKTKDLFLFLNETISLPTKISDYTLELEESGQLEYAEEMSQVWKVIIDIMDQMVAILGEDEISKEEYSTILKTGLESVQIGMLPPAIDQIILGSMQRTRVGNIKALFVLGANDGVLPAFSGEETLLNEEERDFLYQKGNIICRSDEAIMLEEQLAIYRNLSKPSRFLYMSYSASDSEGGEINPSIIFEKLKRIFGDNPVRKDIFNDGSEDMNLVQNQLSTANYLTDAMRKVAANDEAAPVWKAVYSWFNFNEKQVTDRILKGLTFRNVTDKIDEKLITELYKPSYATDENIILSSPSGLENYSRCPFSFFIQRGIRLKERRIYELDRRNIGDIYHNVLMRFGEQMSRDNKKPLEEDSLWNTMDDNECSDLVDNIYEDVEKKLYNEFFEDNKYEQYRSDRFKKILKQSALELKKQVGLGRIEDMYFETEFRENGTFKPIKIEKDGKTVEIVGKVDRLDVLEDGYAKIIDYKSGSDELKIEDIMSGWQLQLMVYIKAVTESGTIDKEGNKIKPAGVFYFRIPEPHLEVTGLTEAQIKDQISKSINKEFKMDGLVINDRSIVESITGDLTQKDRKIISASIDKDDPNIAKGKAVIDRESFNDIQSAVSNIITDLCEKMLDGDISAYPRRSKAKKISACDYCDNKGICGYDDSFKI